MQRAVLRFLPATGRFWVLRTKIMIRHAEDIGNLIALFGERRYPEAESLARELAERFPEHGFAWKTLGLIATQSGRHEEALRCLKKSSVLLPTDKEVLTGLGNSQRGLGRLHDAMVSYSRALWSSNGSAEIYCNLGAVLQDLGRLEDAATNYRKALEFNPRLVEARSNLGNILRLVGRIDDAVKNYRQALIISPCFAEVDFNLGNALREVGQRDAAIVCFRRALNSKPDFVEALGNLGALLLDAGRPASAATCYRQALMLKPEYFEALSNLGNSLQALGQLECALTVYRRALKLKPDYFQAHSNLGNALRGVGHLNEASTSCMRSLDIEPDYAEGFNNLGNALQDLGRFEAALACYRRAVVIQPEYLEARSNMLFGHNYLADLPADLLLAEARLFGDVAARRAKPCHSWSNPRDSKRTLLIGLVSGDLRNHPVGYFIEGILAALKRNGSGGFRIVAYHNHLRSDDLTDRIRAYCHSWRVVTGLTDEQLAERVLDDGIDVLIDLSGHTAYNRLPMFAWKPAPVQATWLGYFGTTGVAAIDYLIADPFTLTEAGESQFSETVWRLPDTRLCLAIPDLEIEVSPLPALGCGHITFGCFNNLAKMNDSVVALWGKILAAVPGSKLFLKSKQLGDSSVQQTTIDRFAAQGVTADRLILEGFGPRRSYFAAYHRVDIALDPFPYPGGTTSVEGLWMGVPVITLAGENFLSRQGLGILMNAGLPEWVASSGDEYVSIAIALTDDLPGLAALRGSLRRKVLSCPLFDAERFALQFERAVRGMWSHWINRSPAAGW